VDDRLRAVFVRREQGEMHRPPGDLRVQALHGASSEHLHYSRAAADGRHRALVVVLERLRLLPADEPGDRLADVLARLKRYRADLREDLLSLRVFDRGDVADDEHLGVRREAELRVDANPVSALEVEPERLDESVALQARAPDERVRLQLRPRFELDPLRLDRL